MFVAKALEYTLRRVVLLTVNRSVLLQNTVDDIREGGQFRAFRWLASPISRRFRMPQHLPTVSRAMPNRLAASRWLRPSTWQASRTRRYRSTVYILPPSISKKIEGYRWQSFTPPAAGKSRRFRGLICHRRSHQGSFPPPALPGIRGNTSPSATPPARPAPRGVPVGACHTTDRASRVATVPLFHACRRKYPGGAGRCARRSLPGRWKPSPLFGASASAMPVWRPALRSLALRPTWSLSRPGRPVAPECFSRSRYLLQPLRLLPAGATLAGRDSHPLGDSTFPQRTNKSSYQPVQFFSASSHLTARKFSALG